MPPRKPPLRSSWVASDRRLPRLIARPVRHFLATESAGGVVLLGATVVALIWANSPWQGSYESFWQTRIGFEAGSFVLSEDLRHWVNDGLMTLFFFLVGVEIKRELVVGELNERTKAALPAIAALGGMVVPALIYVALNAGGPGSAGWGIPMATDIAFAVGVLALLGRRAPTGLKVFLLSLAIVDDIGAILVIALFYSSGIELSWLAGALAAIGLVVIMKRVRIWWVPAYVLVGSAAWLFTLESGIHATIAGVALGLLTPSRPSDPEGAAEAIESSTKLLDDPSPAAVRATMIQAQEVVSVGERLAETLHPWTSFAIVPIFALGNAGVALSAESVADAASSPITVGIVLGLVVGKLVGVTGFAWLAVRTGLGTLPASVTWQHIMGAGAVAGIGFTVSLFVAGLAFSSDAAIGEAKVGILVASVVATALGAVVLGTAREEEEEG